MSVSSGVLVEGTVIGPYRIVREIGGGGMGVVYEAADDALDRTVALKIISPRLAASDDFRARFTREARLLAALDSPQVVHVYAHGEVDGQLYLATQLIPDGDLGAMLRQYGAPPVRVALDLVAQVAAGVAAAHEGGMIHRDIKPANILLRRRGTTLAAYVGDFGIARRLDGEATHASRTGTVGTPSYMAPELHTGGAAGVASDIYSVGCLLWAALSGHAPYRGTTDGEVVCAHLEQPVPQLPGRSPLVSEVNRILRTAMAKDPADRYATSAQLSDDLLGATNLPSKGAARSRRSTGAGGHARRTPVLALAVPAAALVLAAVVWGLSSDDQPAVRPTTPGSSATPAPDVALAEDNLAAALLAQGLLTEGQSACTARQWIDTAGLDAMIGEGFFDEDLTFTDRPAAGMSPEMQSAATAATLACASQTR